MLLVQLWDTDPSTGPTDSWTIHGLWPDNCDGTYDTYCDTSREYTNITAILEYYGQTELLDYMNTYWVSDSQSNEDFWEHEWAAHGTCISTLETDCYLGYTTGEELVDFFQKTVDLFKSLDTYQFLSDAGIVPSETTTYTSAEIYDALTSAYGYNVTIECEDDAIYEVEYYYNVEGSVQKGEFVETSPDDDSSSCPSTGVKYLPKTSTSSTTATATTSTTSTTATSTGSAFSGKGYLLAYTSGSQDGCLISYGTWYTTGTCASFTATVTDSLTDTFTLKSSKGPCGVSNNEISCSSSMSYSNFSSIDGYLAYDESNVFYATAVPTGSTQATVYTTTESVEVQFGWEST